MAHHDNDNAANSKHTSQATDTDVTSPDRFSNTSIAFHWIVGLLIIAAVALSFYMESLPPSSYKYQVYNLHKSLGFMVLLFAVPRLLWRLNHGRPPKLSTHKAWEQRLSSIVTWSMYGLIFAMPLSGWLMSSASGHPLKLFGWIGIPAPIGKDKELGELLGETHEWLGDALKILILLHVAGTLKHLVIDRDLTLYRMLPFSIFKLKKTPKE